ncbi:hypothetical protein BD626DRAFT_16101 [Schizophyllum amplum]|uniref:Uncharacterized protein n=1 Tax=Schizophyllum amplum TaxID=97359 RepID=A0A550CY01_9AGAR|nr:hypothetical protein BD626DRAFT_16101 [Auriculariopsis ampla]
MIMTATTPSTPFLSLDFSFSPLLSDTPTQTLPFLRELQALLGEDAEAQLAQPALSPSRVRSSVRFPSSTPTHLSTSSVLNGSPSPHDSTFPASKRAAHESPAAIPEVRITAADSATALSASSPVARALDNLLSPLSSNSSSLKPKGPVVPALRRSSPSLKRRHGPPLSGSPRFSAKPKEIIALLTLLEQAEADIVEDVARVKENVREVRDALAEVRETRKTKEIAHQARVAAAKQSMLPTITLTAVSSDFWLS